MENDFQMCGNPVLRLKTTVRFYKRIFFID